MKYLTLLALCAVLFAGCSVNTSGNIDFDGKDIQYKKDSRTGLCFGIVASRKSFNTDATGLGLTCVPCDKVGHLIK